MRYLIFSVLCAMLVILDSCHLHKPLPGRSPSPPGHSPHHAPGPPPWAPAHGYRAKTRYIFFPEIGIYYDLSNSSYTYPRAGKWINQTTLSSDYAHYDLQKMEQEELDERQTPQLHHRGRQGVGNPLGEKGNAPKGKGPPPGKGPPKGKGGR